MFFWLSNASDKLFNFVLYLRFIELSRFISSQGLKLTFYNCFHHSRCIAVLHLNGLSSNKSYSLKTLKTARRILLSKLSDLSRFISCQGLELTFADCLSSQQMSRLVPPVLNLCSNKPSSLKH